MSCYEKNKQIINISTKGKVKSGMSLGLINLNDVNSKELKETLEYYKDCKKKTDFIYSVIKLMSKTRKKRSDKE